MMNPIDIMDSVQTMVIDSVQTIATDKVNSLIENHSFIVSTNQITAEINSKLDKHINDFGITKISINHQMELMNNTMSQIRDDTSKIETNMVNLKTELKTDMREFKKDMGDRMDEIKGLLYQLLLNGSNNNRNSNARSSNDGNN